MAEQEAIPVYQFRHKERKDDIAKSFRCRRNVRDAIVFIGGAQEKAQAFNGMKVNGRFQFDRDKTVYVNHYSLENPPLRVRRRAGLWLGVKLNFISEMLKPFHEVAFQAL